MNWQFYLLIFGILFAFIAAMLLLRHWMYALHVSNEKSVVWKRTRRKFRSPIQACVTKMNRPYNG